MGIESTCEYLNRGTASLSQVPLEGLKETFEDTLNVVPSISSRVTEIASIIGGGIAKLEEGSTGIIQEAKNQLGNTSEAYARIAPFDPDNDPPPQVIALWQRFTRTHRHTSEVVGSGSQRGNEYCLVLSFEKMQGYLAALEAEMANYEQFRNGILNDIDQAEIARAQTIDQATALNETL